MKGNRKLTARDAALTITFTALYAVFGFLKISPIIGLPGQAITAAAIIAPVVGILLGPYVGTLSTFFGGIIGFFLGSLSYPSLTSGVATSFCAGMIKKRQRTISALTYAILLLLFAFFPAVGPAWLFPWETWFQTVGLIILASPLQSIASKFLDSNSNTELTLGLLVTCLTSSLAGQIAGSLVFETMVMDPTVLTAYWQTLTFLYPIERIIIALAATLIGAPLLRIIKSSNMPGLLNRSK